MFFFCSFFDDIVRVFLVVFYARSLFLMFFLRSFICDVSFVLLLFAYNSLILIFPKISHYRVSLKHLRLLFAISYSFWCREFSVLPCRGNITKLFVPFLSLCFYWFQNFLCMRSDSFSLLFFQSFVSELTTINCLLLICVIAQFMRN